MKKIIPLFLLAFLISCSSDSDSNITPDTNAILIRKLITTSESEFGIRKDTTYYNYNGTKLISIDSGDLFSQFYYTGDLITNIKEYYNGHFDADLVFQYDDLGRISHYTEYVYQPEQRVNRKADFTHNSDRSVSSEFYIFDMGEMELTHAYTFHYFFNANRDIERIEAITPSGTTVEHRVYDNKHNPFMNVKGFEALDFMTLGVYSNITSITYTGYDSGHNQENERATTYTYNEDDFAVHAVRTFPNMTGARPTMEDYIYE